MADSVTDRSGAGLPLSHTYGYRVLSQKKDYDHDATVPSDTTWTPFESKDQYENTDVYAYLTFYQISAKVFLTVTKDSKGDERSIQLNVTWTKNGGVGFTDDRGAIINWLQLLSATKATLTKSLTFLVCDNFDGMFVLIPCNMNQTYQCGSFAMRKKIPKPIAVLARLMNIVPSTKTENNLYIQSMLKALRLRSDDTTELIPSDNGARVMAPYLTDEDTACILRGAYLGLEPGNKIIRWCNTLVGYDLETTTVDFYFDTHTIVGEMWNTQGMPVITLSDYTQEYDRLVEHLPTLTKDKELYKEWVESTTSLNYDSGALVRAGKYGIQMGLFTANESFIPMLLRSLLTN